ncbi:MRPL53 isoform 2 [Pan troglodytes]|uniref:Mitochondrial ribosomal protein L53 n=3 Tax=Pan TaxID=9596 RepID=A0A2I3SXB0_PANTR|nr:MRPL53 isoform 2 [Pan troglodytes]
MAAALARLGLRPVKQVRVQFCPFEKNVESTRRRASPDYARRSSHRSGNAHRLRLPHPGQGRGGQRGQAGC